MKGFITLGETNFDNGYHRGKDSGTALTFHLTITVDGVYGFITRPEHDTKNIVRYRQSDSLGGQLPVESGIFTLFTDQADPAVKHMTYRVVLQAWTDRPTPHLERTQDYQGRSRNRPLARYHNTVYTHPQRARQ
jgi:hypothetical protein